ncbi:MAG: DinB family protein [Pseudomonadota bacterium]
MPFLSVSHRLAAYTAWADDVMLRNAEQVSEAELGAPRDTLFKSIAGTFDHTLVVAEIFRAHLEGKPHPHTARFRSETLPFSEVAERLRAINRYFVEAVQSWSEDTLSESVSFDFVDGGKGKMSREEILLHLANHATYHRGFVSVLLFPHCIKTAPTDLTVFLRDVWPKMEEEV